MAILGLQRLPKLFSWKTLWLQLESPCSQAMCSIHCCHRLNAPIKRGRRAGCLWKMLPILQPKGWPSLCVIESLLDALAGINQYSGGVILRSSQHRTQWTSGGISLGYATNPTARRWYLCCGCWLESINRSIHQGGSLGFWTDLQLSWAPSCYYPVFEVLPTLFNLFEQLMKRNVCCSSVVGKLLESTTSSFTNQKFDRKFEMLTFAKRSIWLGLGAILTRSIECNSDSYITTTKPKKCAGGCALTNKQLLMLRHTFLA